MRNLGSSPRVRGKRGPRSSPRRQRGLIPACAGKTGRNNESRCVTRAHPRVCGENVAPIFPMRSSMGSSPRVRGKLGCGLVMVWYCGLIPACAGKTYSPDRLSRYLEAHPRVCGENSVRAGCMLHRRGSSPRVRGKPGRYSRGQADHGLIPACAGKTRLAATGRPRFRAHPRVCGENLNHTAHDKISVGSSPRVRGKPDEDNEAWLRKGLIPACAGKTTGTTCLVTRSRAHPRVCGENNDQVSDAMDNLGSSPRVRGKRPRIRRTTSFPRLIPACAGKTRFARARASEWRAHPRVCGENAAFVVAVVSGLGSSPRVRGKRWFIKNGLFDIGLIPACAGKTIIMNR